MPIALTAGIPCGAADPFGFPWPRATERLRLIFGAGLDAFGATLGSAVHACTLPLGRLEFARGRCPRSDGGDAQICALIWCQAKQIAQLLGLPRLLERIRAERWLPPGIPLVDLSEPLSGIGSGPRLISATARENGPGDACKLVGERDCQRQKILLLRRSGRIGTAPTLNQRVYITPGTRLVCPIRDLRVRPVDCS
jgi:hypothetical protein